MSLDLGMNRLSAALEREHWLHSLPVPSWELPTAGGDLSRYGQVQRKLATGLAVERIAVA